MMMAPSLGNEEATTGVSELLRSEYSVMSSVETYSPGLRSCLLSRGDACHLHDDEVVLVHEVLHLPSPLRCGGCVYEVDGRSMLGFIFVIPVAPSFKGPPARAGRDSNPAAMPRTPCKVLDQCLTQPPGPPTDLVCGGSGPPLLGPRICACRVARVSLFGVISDMLSRGLRLRKRQMPAMNRGVIAVPEADEVPVSGVPDHPNRLDASVECS